MAKHNWSVGQTVLAVYLTRGRAPVFDEHTIDKIGRKWATYAGPYEYTFNLETGEVKHGYHTMVFADMAGYEQWQLALRSQRELEAGWEYVHARVRHMYRKPDHITMEDVTALATIFNITPSTPTADA